MLSKPPTFHARSLGLKLGEHDARTDRGKPSTDTKRERETKKANAAKQTKTTNTQALRRSQVELKSEDEAGW